MSAFILLFFMALLSLSIRSNTLLKLLSITTLVASGVLTLMGHATPLHGFALSESIAFFEVILFIVIAASILSEEEKINVVQMLFMAAASVLLLESASLLSFVISYEAVSIISFVLVAHIRNKTEAEGAMKMFISGAVATGFILLGMTLYALEGHSLLAPISGELGLFGRVGVWVLIVGLFYKLTIIPMHTWAADSYAQVRPSHAALLSGVAKSVVALVAFQTFAPFLLESGDFSSSILVVLAIITMTLGNTLALFQKRVAKILAYSSIAHAGYILLAFVAVKSHYAEVGLLYMVTAYIFMQTALFLLLDKLSNGTTTLKLDNLKGLYKRDKAAALFMSVQLFSLAGIPLLAGFLAKAVVVYAVVDAGFVITALIALLNSALSVAYYAWIIKHIYFDDLQEESTIYGLSKSTYISQTVLLMGTLYFGFFASTVFSIS